MTKSGILRVNCVGGLLGLVLSSGCVSNAQSLLEDCPVLDFTGTESRVQEPPKGSKTFTGPVESFASQLIGFSETRARECVEQAGLVWRVVARDAEQFLVTLDFNPDRVNATISSGSVIEVSTG